mgnify:CR=1 FL=1
MGHGPGRKKHYQVYCEGRNRPDQSWRAHTGSHARDQAVRSGRLRSHHVSRNWGWWRSHGANDEGKFICRTTVRSFDSTPYTFTINNTFQGIDPLLASDPTGGDTGTNVKRIKTDFFDSSNATWRKLKFFYINEVPGFGSSDPALDKIQYTITPDGGNEITRLKSIITSQGRSRNILADLEVKIDNTEELGALDYGALLE